MAYENYKTDARYQNRNEDGLPVWAELRHIDGHDYPLMSVHVTAEEAQAAVAAARESGHSAQAFTSANPKFAEVEGASGTYTPARGAVYGFPRGQQCVVTDSGHSLEERPKKEKPAKAAKKGSKKASKTAKADE